MESCTGDVPSPAIRGDALCFAASMTDPRGQPSSPILAPLTLSHWSKPSVESPLRPVCRGPPVTPYPRGTPALEYDPCNPSPLEPLTLSHGRHLDPLTLRHGCQNTKGNLLQIVSGGLPFPFPPHHLSPPSTADIPDNGPVSALLFVSVSRVNSTPLQPCLPP